MTTFLIRTTNELAWRDAARRLHRARLVADSPQVEVFDGALLAKPSAMLAALAAGRHVLLVAEPCLTRDQLASLADAARKQGVTFAIQNPDRFLASRQLIRKQLEAALGSAELVRSHRWENHVAPAPLGLPGPLAGEIEQAVWFYDRPVRSVFAMQPAGLSAWQVQLGFAPGMATIDYCDSLQGTTATGYRSLSIIGSRGSAQIDDQNNAQLAYVGGDGPTGVTVGEGVRHLALLLDDVAAAVESKHDLSATVADARHVLDVVAAVQRSLTTHEAVSVEVAG